MALKLITQSELVELISDETGYTKSDVRHFFDALNSVVSNAISDCKRVKIANVTIEPKLKKATKKRKGRNPATGEDVMIAAKPASVTVKAKVHKALLEQAPSVGKLKKRI